MRRRLFDGLDQGLGEDIQVIEGLTAPTRQRGFSSLVVVLQLALQAAGHTLSYAELMARTGAAFMLHCADNFPPDLPLRERDAHVVEALRELGWQAELHHTPAPADTLDLIRREAAAGRPACALGWGSNPAEWSLMAGFQASDLLGYPFGGTGNLERKPPTIERLVILGDPSFASSQMSAGPAASSVGRGLVPRRPSPWHATMLRAIALLRSNRPHYQRWLLILDRPEPYGPSFGQFERFVGEQRLSEALADARDAASQFLAASVTLLPEAEDEMAQAADVAERVAEQAEKLLVAPDLIQRAHLAEDPDWRHDRQALLRGMMELEDRLAALLRRALWLAGVELKESE